jgi:hypothetical protein
MTQRKTDTVAKDYDSIIESLIEFATSEFGEQTSANRVWTNFNVSSFSRNWAEVVAYVGDQLSFYLDTQANQSYLETATIPAYVLRIAQQAGYEVPTQQSASGRVTFTTSGPYVIPRGTTVSSNGTNFFTTRQVQGSLTEEVIVEVVQGEQINETFTAEGTQNEEIVLNEAGIIVDLTNANPDLRSPIVRVNGNTYDVRITPIEASSVDFVVVRDLLPDGRTRLTFGDGIFGRRLTPNESIQVIYRTGGGTEGNLEPGEIETISRAIPNVTSVTNKERTAGGSDLLSIREIKDRIPLFQKTTAGAISLADFSDILIANFPQVLTANSAINNTDAGIDIDVFVVPQGQVVSPITTNVTLSNTLNDFLERNKVVGARFVIKNGEEVKLLIDIEAFLNQDASRSSVESEIRQRLGDLYDLRTGGANGQGMKFAQNVRLGDLFDVLKNIQEISRFEVKRFTISPRIEERKASPNQVFSKSEVTVFEVAGENEWLVATSQIANPEPQNGQVQFKVYKRTLATVTSLTEDSITDSNLDLTESTGTAIVIGNTTVTDPASVFQLGQFDNFILVDSNNAIWRISQTKSNSLIVTSPALNDASTTTVANGQYSIVKNFSGAQIAVSNINFSVLYNNKNTFFSPGSSFNVIATNRTSFFISEEQANVGTYGVPVAITQVTPDGPIPGDLVTVKFNGTPNFSAVNDTFTLIDRTGETFEVVQVSDVTTPVAQYGGDADVTDSVVLTDSGSGRFISMPFIADRDVSDSFITVGLRVQKDSNPAGGIRVELRADDNGAPGASVQTSDLIPSTSIDASPVFNTVTLTFPSEVELAAGQKYHLVISGDNAYQISYNNGDGELRVGIDTVTKGYFPATTAAGTINLTDNSNVNRSVKATAQITVLDNNIRQRVQATNDVKIISNDFTGINQIIIDNVSFQSGVDFVVGGSITATRDNLKNAIDSNLAGRVIATNQGTDTIALQANSATYPGELGNEITIEINEASPTNFQIRGTQFGGGLDGDTVIVRGPKFLNTTNVSYSYNTLSGVIQYSAPVSLPAFEQDMSFVDGEGSELAILSVDDLNNRLTLATGQTVDLTQSGAFSGSITGNFRFEFGVEVIKGVTLDETAENLASVIDSSVSGLTAIDTMNVIDVTVDVSGEYGNKYSITTEDLGTENFEIDNFSGGEKPDLITVGNSTFRAIGEPTIDPNEFEVGVDAQTTLNNLASKIIASGEAAAVVSGSEMTISALLPGNLGNDIALAVNQAIDGVFVLSGDSLEGGQNNIRLLDSDDDITYIDYIPEADLVFSVSEGEDIVVVASKSDLQGNQITPQTSVNNQVDSSIGKRYYSDGGELSFLIATKTPNAFIIGADDVNLFGRGTVGGNPNTRVDQFTFRTSKFEDDVTTLRENEIAVLKEDDLDINLLGGVE